MSMSSFTDIVTISVKAKQLFDDCLKLASSDTKRHSSDLLLYLIHKHENRNLKEISNNFYTSISTSKYRLQKTKESIKIFIPSRALNQELLIHLVNGIGFEHLRKDIVSALHFNIESKLEFIEELYILLLHQCPEHKNTIYSNWLCKYLYTFRKIEANHFHIQKMNLIKNKIDSHSLEKQNNLAYLKLQYSTLRNKTDHRPSDWQHLCTYFEKSLESKINPTFNAIKCIENAMGWKQAHDFILNRIPPKHHLSPNNSWYMKYLLSHYSLKNNQPRVASRHLKELLKITNSSFFKAEIQKRLSFTNLHHQGGVLDFNEPDHLFW